MVQHIASRSRAYSARDWHSYSFLEFLGLVLVTLGIADPWLMTSFSSGIFVMLTGVVLFGRDEGEKPSMLPNCLIATLVLYEDLSNGIPGICH